MEKPLKEYPTIAPCGLDCGLCPRYYTDGNSRCPGCCGPDFFSKHPSCSMITCCVKKKGLETCGECPEFPCARFLTEVEYRGKETSSYPPYRKVLPNLYYVREHGIKEFVARQGERIGILETMLDGFNDGRSRSFYCRACALLEPDILKRSIGQAEEALTAGNTPADDLKNRAKVLKSLLQSAGM
jgi:Protein of unknown function (DUF3795)